MTAVYDSLPASTVVDGEIVRWSESGRLDFAALQHRNANRGNACALARAEPAHYIVVDVLVAGGEQLAHRPFTERRAALEDLLATVPGTSPVAPGMATQDVQTGRHWYEQLAAVGVEGLMVKPGRDPYRPGNRSAWAKVKVKHYATTEAIVGGITGTLDRPRDLILGRYNDDGDFIVAGRTTTLKPDVARPRSPTGPLRTGHRISPLTAGTNPAHPLASGPSDGAPALGPGRVHRMPLTQDGYAYRCGSGSCSESAREGSTASIASCWFPVRDTWNGGSYLE